MDKFWMIMDIERGIVAGEYYDKEKAETEIESLVKRIRKPHILLEAIEICEPAEVPVKWNKLREKEG